MSNYNFNQTTILNENLKLDIGIALCMYLPNQSRDESQFSNLHVEFNWFLVM